MLGLCAHRSRRHEQKKAVLPLLDLPLSCLGNVLTFVTPKLPFLLYGSSVTPASRSSSSSLGRIRSDQSKSLSSAEMGQILGIAELSAEYFVIGTRSLFKCIDVWEKGETPVTRFSWLWPDMQRFGQRRIAKELRQCIDQLQLNPWVTQLVQNDEEPDAEASVASDIGPLFWATTYCCKEMSCQITDEPNISARELATSVVNMKNKVHHIADRVRTLLQQELLSENTLAWAALAVEFEGHAKPYILKRSVCDTPFYWTWDAIGSRCVKLRQEGDRATLAVTYSEFRGPQSNLGEPDVIRVLLSHTKVFDLAGQQLIPTILTKWNRALDQTQVAESRCRVESLPAIEAALLRASLPAIEVRPASLLEALTSLEAIAPGSILADLLCAGDRELSADSGSDASFVLEASAQVVLSAQTENAESLTQGTAPEMAESVAAVTEVAAPVIQEVLPEVAEPVAVISSEESARIADELWASGVERRLAAAPASAPSHKALRLLTFGRHTRDMDAAILASPLARKLVADGVDVQPSWANGAKVLAHGVTRGNLDLELWPRHVVCAAGDEDLVLEALRALPYNRRPRLKIGAGQQAVPSATSLLQDVSGASSASECESEDSFETNADLVDMTDLPVRNTFIDFKPPRVASARTVHTV